MIYDFKGRYQNAFGFVSPNVGNILANTTGAVIDRLMLQGSNVYLWDKSTSFDEIKLYRDEDGNREEFLFAFRSLAEQYSEVFATPPMLSLKRGKKLVITPIDNSDIEVIERYATEPYTITWRGLMIDMENHEFPIDKMETLNGIFETNNVWNVVSEILNKVGVEALVVVSITIDFVEGFEDTISYVLETRAVKPLEYQLLNQ